VKDRVKIVCTIFNHSVKYIARTTIVNHMVELY
jgi:hypothetical protein